MKMKKYFVPDGKKNFLTTVLNRDEIDYDFMEIDGRLYIWTPLSCRQYRVMLEDALDFQLCSYLGYLIRGGSKSSYCILTNDKGFDAAVSFWAEKGIKIYRHSLAAEIGYPDKTRVGYMPNLGAILSLKANNPDLKTIEKIIKESDSVAVVLNKITTVLGTRTGKNYCKKLEKHLKKYYLVNK